MQNEKDLCLGKLFFFFHFFIASISEGVTVKETFRWIVLDTKDLCPQGSYMLHTHHANMCNSQLCDSVLFYCCFLLLLGIGFECALCFLAARAGSIVEAVFSVLQSASLRVNATVTVIRASQKKLLVALFSY